MECGICGKEFNKFGIGIHKWRMHGEGKNHDPNRGYKDGSRQVWNKNLTKETDVRVLKGGLSVSLALKGKAHPPTIQEVKDKLSQISKDRHLRDPESHPNRKVAGNKNKMTYPERVAAEWFDRNGINYEHNKKIINFYPDFTVGNIIIEIDGEQWHSSLEQVNRDKERTVVLESQGFMVVRIRVKEGIEKRLEGIFLRKKLIFD